MYCSVTAVLRISASQIIRREVLQLALLHCHREANFAPLTLCYTDMLACIPRKAHCKRKISDLKGRGRFTLYTADKRTVTDEGGESYGVVVIEQRAHHQTGASRVNHLCSVWCAHHTPVGAHKQGVCLRKQSLPIFLTSRLYSMAEMYVPQCRYICKTLQGA